MARGQAPTMTVLIQSEVTRSRSLGTAWEERSAEPQDGPEGAFVGVKVHSGHNPSDRSLLTLIPSATELTQVCLGCHRLSDLTRNRCSQSLSPRSRASQDTVDDRLSLKLKSI